MKGLHVSLLYLPCNFITPGNRGYPIGLDKGRYRRNVFLISPRKHVLGSHLKHLSEALIMSTHNICCCGEIRKYQYFWIEKAS